MVYAYVRTIVHYSNVFVDTRGLQTQFQKRLKISFELRALRGKFGPLWSQKLKVVFHQFHPTELPKCNILAFILLLPLLW